MAEKGKTAGLERLVRATGYSLAGLRAAWSGEAAFRQEAVLVAVLLPMGWWLGGNGLNRAVLIGSLFVVLVAELLNSGIEAAIDRFGPERHPLSKRAKDLGSAAVFIALLNVFIIWLLIAWDRFGIS